MFDIMKNRQYSTEFEGKNERWKKGSERKKEKKECQRKIGKEGKVESKQGRME